MKQQKQILLFSILLSLVGIKVHAYDIEVKNADGVTIYYYWKDRTHTELTVSYHEDPSNTGRYKYTGNIVIPDSVKYGGKYYNVTAIGKGAFYSCMELTSITIPNSITSIDDNAFCQCYGLTSVIIPNSVTSIGNGAFIYCTGLTSISIGNRIKTIGKNAFYDCSNLISVHISDLDSWYKISFSSLESNPLNYAHHLFINNEEVKEVIIPSSMTFISNYSFAGCSGLTSITIPNSVTSIGNSAFFGCSGLTSVIIPNSVTTIEDSAFRRTNLKSVTIGTGVQNIGECAFKDNVATTRSTLNNDYRPIKVIWLTNTPPNGYKNAEGIINYVANDLYNSLSNRTLYPFLSSIFEVDGVKYVPISPSERKCDAIDCTYNESAEIIKIGKNVLYKGIQMTVMNINQYTCYENNYVKDVDLSFEGNLNDFAFEGCANIIKISIQNVGNIGSFAFQACTNIITANIESYGNISQSAFANCIKLQTAIIHNQGRIHNNAFANCSSMANVVLGEKITSIDQYAFGNCKKLKNIVIPDAITSLGSKAFSGCTSLTSVKMGQGIKEIDTSTFEECASLMDMQIGSNVTTIGSNAFFNCSTLPKIEIPQSVTKINNYAFSGCKSLKEVIMVDRKADVKTLTLGSNENSPLFADCPLDSVYIGRNISYSTSSNYGYSPFYRNTSIRSVTITDKETEISPNEFYGCTNLKNVRIGDGVETIGDWAFSGCCSLDYFAFGSSVKTIGKEAFSDCTAMTKLISRAVTPPTCGSQALDDINKWNCSLSVPIGAKAAYQQANQWKDFFFINDDVTGMSKLTNTNVAPNHIYDLNGKKLKEPSKGINIIGGKKVVVK